MVEHQEADWIFNTCRKTQLSFQLSTKESPQMNIVKRIARTTDMQVMEITTQWRRSLKILRSNWTLYNQSLANRDRAPRLLQLKVESWIDQRLQLGSEVTPSMKIQSLERIVVRTQIEELCRPLRRNLLRSNYLDQPSNNPKFEVMIWDSSSEKVTIKRKQHRTRSDRLARKRWIRHKIKPWL